ncbi:unnamed protein product, partial [Musa banksii]
SPAHLPLLLLFQLQLPSPQLQPPSSPRRTAPPFLCFLLQETEVPPLHPLPLLLFFLTIS